SATRRVTTAGDMSIARAAAAKLPSSITRRKTRMELRRSIGMFVCSSKKDSKAVQVVDCFTFSNTETLNLWFISVDRSFKVHPSQQTTLPKQTERKRNRSEKTTGQVAGTIHQFLVRCSFLKEIIMTSTKFSAIVLAIAAATTGAAFAGDQSLS